jgi:hypothetical protein
VESTEARGERGQITPALMLLVVALLAAGVLLLQVGRATVIQARTTTAADAAALAAAGDLRDQLAEQLRETGFNEPRPISVTRMRRDADTYARRNGGRVVDFEVRLSQFEIYVQVESLQAMDGAAGVDSAGRRGLTEAWSEVATTYAFGPPPDGATPVGGGDARPGVNGNGGNVEDYINALAPQMQVAVRALNQAMGGTLVINSGYRSAAYQAQLCQEVTGPCAPPGRSMHQYGLAIDVGNWQAALAALRANPEIELCHPLPENDAWHFSHLSGSECGGSRGNLGGGGGPGGGFYANYATFDVHLIDGWGGSGGAPAVGTGPADLATWEALAQCESSGDWQINTGNGFYGGLQFTLDSWYLVGGTGYPHQASKGEQIMRAQRLQAIQGWGAWPVCSARLGLR